MTENNYSTDSNHQRVVLLAWLQIATITILQARLDLDIFHPATRIQELRDLGYKIETHWTIVDTGRGKHRSACYALLSGV